jgi:O-antigen/teichoic acid export membrane protein
MTKAAASSVSENVTILFAARVITWMSAFLLMLFLPRYLGPVEFGRFYLGQSVMMILALFIDFGGSYSISKVIARDRTQAGSVLVDSLGIRILFWLVVFALLVIIVAFVHYPVEVKIILIIFGFSMSWTSARAVFSNCYTGIEMMNFPSYGTMAETLFISLVGVGALLAGTKAIGFTMITIGGSFIGFLITLKYRAHIASVLPRFNLKRSMELLTMGTPYFLNTLFGMIYFRIDTIMLSMMVPEEVVGWYGAAYRFFDSLMFVPLILTTAVFPVMSRMWVQDEESLTATVQKILDYVIIAGIPVSIGMFAFSEIIIQFFYGVQQYHSSIVLLKIFALGSLMLYIDIVIGTILLASDKQWQLSVTSFIAIFINIILNYFLIPFCQHHMGNGAIGSSIATILTEFFVMMRMIFMLPAHVTRRVHITKQLKAAAAGVCMILSIWGMRAVTVHWIIQVAGAVVVFFMSAAVLRIFDAADIVIFKKMIPSQLKNFRLRG